MCETASQLGVRMCERFDAAEHVAVEPFVSPKKETQRFWNPPTNSGGPARVARRLHNLLSLRRDRLRQNRARWLISFGDWRQLGQLLQAPNLIRFCADALHQLGNVDFSNFGFDHGSRRRRADKGSTRA